MGKDWTGNKTSAHACIGARNYAEEERQVDDFYATDPKAITALFNKESFSDNIWECACGNGALSEQMEYFGKRVKSTDLVDRGYGMGGVNFLLETKPFKGDIITNPPYKYATEFVLKALELTQNKVAMFLKLTYLEGKDRYKRIFSICPPKNIYVFVNRVECYKNDIRADEPNNAICYAWFVWEKGYKDKPKVSWITSNDTDIEPNQIKFEI